jgi:hypothetical protein
MVAPPQPMPSFISLTQPSPSRLTDLTDGDGRGGAGTRLWAVAALHYPLLDATLYYSAGVDCRQVKAFDDGPTVGYLTPSSNPNPNLTRWTVSRSCRWDEDSPVFT